MQAYLQKYEKVIDSIARKSIRRWMVGVEINDIKQELWVHLLKVLQITPNAGDEFLKDELDKFIAVYKHALRDLKFGRKSSDLDNHEEVAMSFRWSYIGNLWEQYLDGLSERDNSILRLVSQGYKHKIIASKLGMSHRTVASQAPKLLKGFERYADEDVSVVNGGRNARKQRTQ